VDEVRIHRIALVEARAMSELQEIARFTFHESECIVLERYRDSQELIELAEPSVFTPGSE
jgi:hypothetical protein